MIVLLIIHSFVIRWFDSRVHEFTKQDDWFYQGGFWERKENQSMDIF